MVEIVQQLAERRGLLDESQQREVCTATPCAEFSIATAIENSASASSRMVHQAQQNQHRWMDN